MMRRKRSGSRGRPRRGAGAGSSSFSVIELFFGLDSPLYTATLTGQMSPLSEVCSMTLESRRNLGSSSGLRRPAAALALLILSACSTPAPRAPSPPVALAAHFSNERLGALAVPALDDAWWDGFGDATLARLVNEALSANQDVAMALQACRAGARRGPTRKAHGSGPQWAYRLPRHAARAAFLKRSSNARPTRVRCALALMSPGRSTWPVVCAPHATRRRPMRKPPPRVSTVPACSWPAKWGDSTSCCAVRRKDCTSCRPWRAAQRQTAVRVESRLREGQTSAFDLDRARAEADALDAQVPALRMLVGTTQTKLGRPAWRNPVVTGRRNRIRPSNGQRRGSSRRASPANCSGAAPISSPQRPASARKRCAAPKPARSGGPRCS